MKGERTRTGILERAVDLASLEGLEGPEESASAADFAADMAAEFGKEA